MEALTAPAVEWRWYTRPVMAEKNPRRRFLAALAAGGFAGASTARAAGPVAGTSVYNVADFGARRDGRGYDTKAIQAAIDACAAAGGGTVYFPAGHYFTGGLILRSNVHLYLSAGAVVQGSPHLEQYPRTIPRFRSYTDNYTERSLLFAEDCENIGLHGEGVLDGSGAAFEGPYKVRPYMIRFVSCRRVSVTGLTIRNSPMWVQHYLACDDVLIDGITVHSRVNKNNDGIDIDCCHRVVIANSNVSSGDDAIVLKSTADRATENVAITNCVLSSYCNAFKLGTESNGGFRDIVLSNCTMYDTRLSGIALECVDGGIFDGVTVSSVTMRDVKNPIFVRLGNRARPFREGGPKPGVGVLRNVVIRDVKATGASRIGCAISGIPGHAIENLTIDTVYILSEGGVAEAVEKVPEKEDAYPEHKMFGTLPAHGFFCRHVRGLRLRNVELLTAEADARPALVCEDVSGLELNGWVFAGSVTPVRFKAVRDVLVRGCRLRDAVPIFLDASGGGVRDVALLGNDLRRADKPVAGRVAGLRAAGNAGG